MGCSAFGAFSENRDNIVPVVYWGTRAQNHRGQQSWGFATCVDSKFRTRKGLHLLPQWPYSRNNKKTWADKLESDRGLGSARYTTFGKTDPESLLKGAQPVVTDHFAEVFNGGIVETKELREKIETTYPRFGRPNCDLEYITRRQNASPNVKDIVETVRDVMKEVDGAYSVVAISKDGDFFTFRDPHGIRPLCFGYDENRGLHAVSSETVGLDINDIPYYLKDFEVRPGEIIFFRKEGMKREQLVMPQRRALCSFELAYFARPDSRLPESTDKCVYEIREEFGRNLVDENPEIFKDSDVILSIPETADDAAMGAYEASGLKWDRCTRRHRYVIERAFQLLKSERESTIGKKINIIPGKVKGKKVATIDDSIVRTDTARKYVEKLRKYGGVKKVYVLSTFPKIISPCLYGIDMATHKELIGADKNEEEIAKVIDADAVRYQSIDNFVKATGISKDRLCLGCITGKYPTPCAQRIMDKNKEAFESGIMPLVNLKDQNQG
jgi:amidophosphoribosyltransferase